MRTVAEISKDIAPFFAHSNEEKNFSRIVKIVGDFPEPPRILKIYQNCVYCNKFRSEDSQLFRLGVGVETRFCHSHHKEFVNLVRKYEALSLEEMETFKAIWDVYCSVEKKSKL